MPPDRDRLRATIEHLAAIERPSASPGEREAAEWIAARLTEEGFSARVEEERAHGTYWVPLGLLTAAAGVAGVAGPRGLAAGIGMAAAAGVADDVSAGPHVVRRALPKRPTFNVVAEGGDPEARRTLVFLAHHDAAHGGLIFTPQLVTLVADRFPDWYDRQTTLPQVMRVVAAGPLLVAAGALTGRRWLRRLGAVLSLGSAGVFADIATRRVVPGANDNLTAVAVLVELARLLRETPVRGLRVLLVSTGSEESFMEGMRAFARRHFPRLPRESTRFVCIESVGSPELVVLEGEGMLWMNDFTPSVREALARAADAVRVPVRRGFRLGLATDGLIAVRGGYETGVLTAFNRYKLPENYHSQTDVPRNVDLDSVEAATRICERLIRDEAAA